MRAPERWMLLAAALAAAAGVAAQAAPVASLPEAEVYRREVFRYQAGGRPDPFQPLVGSDEMVVRAQDLRLVSIIYSSNPRAAMAVFTLPDSARRVRLRVGQRLGAVTVTAIRPRSVDLREDALGVSRMHTLELQRVRTPVPTQGQPAPAEQAAPPRTAPARPQVPTVPVNPRR